MGESLNGKIGEPGKDLSQMAAHGKLQAAAGCDDGKDGGDLSRFERHLTMAPTRLRAKMESLSPFS